MPTKSVAGELFVDAGGWIALADEDDRHHTAAAGAYPDFLERYVRLITTTLVVAEAYIVLRLGLGHGAAVRFLDLLEASPRIHRVDVDATLERRAEEILRRFRDQPFSYTDAVSFAVMESRAIGEAFAFDCHFATAGFVRLPQQ
ncbi:MAG: type II toxin-antitoxin system VapC family toxin [Chloroflexota bacterium]|nr:type II toxin-antitoxin system VapC family toxin [Chloroflexota bacterium]